MAKINQIQNAMKELDGGAFQKLADSYLLRKGYPQINPIGSVAGSNKVRKGTPDTLIPTSDGKYVFGEYTTISGNQICSKFSDDIAKCLNEDKTGIEINKVQEIVLCYTSELSAEEVDKLRVQCEVSKVNLNLFGLGAISYDLLEKYPRIAKDYLGVEVDTGQVVPLDDFISLYESNKLATTLQTEFHFRMDEKNDLLSLIQENSLVIISGPAGVGKSRVAVECYRQFIEENKSYKAYCLFNQGIDLFEDIKSYFSDSGDFLIFVDDANRISGFQYVIQLLQTKRSDQNFKILVTVRDYASDKIRESCQPIGGGSEITIGPFTDEEIKGLLQNEFDIKNHIYLDRIIEIAQGNPRLAVMAAQVAKESNTLESIRDVTELYDKYYSSIKSDLVALEDGGGLEIAGIVAFFRSVDRTNERLMSDIERVFGISAEDFWEASKKLHDMEVLDMFENEVVKISDQVLSTYIFYLVVFKEKRIDFSVLLNDLFPKYKQRLIDSMNPIFNAFNFEEIKKTMEPAVDNVWNEMQKRNEDDFLQLIDVFWFLKPTDTLIYIQGRINGINGQDFVFDDIKFEVASNSSLPGFLSALPLFRYLGEENQLKMSLDLFLQYAEKQPEETSKVLHWLIDKYGFQPDSHRYNYSIQHAVVDKLLEKSCSGENEYFTRLFVALAGGYLHTHFSSAESGKAYTLTFTQFDLADTLALQVLREKIIKQLFSLYKNKKYQEIILKLLLSYTQPYLNISVSSIVEKDSGLILPFLNSSFDPSNILHCIVVQQYFRLLKRFNIEVEEPLKTQFKSAEYKIYDLITNKLERAELKLSNDAYEKHKKKKIKKLTSLHLEEDYDDLFHQLHDVLKILGKNSHWAINQGILSIFEELSRRDVDLSCKVLGNYLRQGDYLEINTWIVTSSMLLNCEVSRFFDVINSPEYATKNRWLFSYYQHLPSNKIQQKHISILCELYRTSEHKYFINNFDYLLKYEAIKKGLIADIVKIIIERSNLNPEIANSLSLVFNPNTEINKNLNSVFSENPTLLEDAYLVVDRVDEHADYDGSTLTKLFDSDDRFIDKYIEDKFLRKNYLSRYDDKRDYSFIWKRGDYMKIMSRITSVLVENDPKGYGSDYFRVFFEKGGNEQTEKSISEEQDKYLLKEIRASFCENVHMQLLFSVISGSSSKRKLIFYKEFLVKNAKFDEFCSLPLEPSVSSWSGSAVPMLQEKIGFLEDIMSLCNSVDLLKHRQFIERNIQGIRNRIQHEKKRDFTEAF